MWYYEAVCMQARTEFLLESLKSNLCATYLHVPHDHVEVTQVTGTTQEVTKEVEGRSEDASLAHSLGSVLLQHATTFIVETNAGNDDTII